MSLYLDASVLVPLFVQEASTARVQARLLGAEVFISDFAIAEASAAIGRLARVGQLNEADATRLFSDMDGWRSLFALSVDATAEDHQAAVRLVRRLSLKLRTPDALHIAIAGRIGADLFTLDQKMAEAARQAGLNVIA